MTIGKGTHRVITLNMLASISVALTRSKNAPNTLAYVRDLIGQDGFVLDEQNVSTTSRDVTKEEHNMLSAATLRSSTIISKGRFVDMPKVWEGSGIVPNEPNKENSFMSQDSGAPSPVVTPMSLHPTPLSDQEFKNFLVGN